LKRAQSVGSAAPLDRNRFGLWLHGKRWILGGNRQFQLQLTEIP